MSMCYRIIDETNFNVLGTFTSRGEAVDFVASLLSVNDGEYLDELPIADDAGPVLFSESLRGALRDRGNSGYDGYEPHVEALSAKGHPR